MALPDSIGHRIVLVLVVLLAARGSWARDAPPTARPDASVDDTAPVEVPSEATAPTEAQPDGAPATDEAPAADQEPTDLAAPIAAPPPPAAGPPARLHSWAIEGQLIDDLAIVLGLIAPIMQDGDSWSDEKQRDLRDYLLALGYHCAILNEPAENGGVKAILQLRPVNLVRHVRVDLDVGSVERAYQPIFADEIRRRMTLRPGSPLAIDEASRSEQLQAEAERLRDYLRNDGFYEAAVAVTEHPEGDFASEIRVKVLPGPPYFVGQISVLGNTAIEAAEITQMFRHDRLCVFWRLCFGSKRFSRQQLTQDVQSLIKKYQRRGFPGVRIETDFDVRHSFNRVSKTVEFTVSIKERRKIDVVFEGNKGGNTDTNLTNALTLSEVGSYDDVEVESSAESIRHYYQERGHFETSVVWEREHFPDFNFERILFYIDEGPRLQVKNVDFTGNASIGADRLRKELNTQVFKRIIIGESGGYATSRGLDQDVGQIINTYQREGFRDVQVRLDVARREDLRNDAAALAASLAGDQRADGLYVTFHITEGPRSLVEDVRFEFDGQRTFSPANLREETELRPGLPFREERAKDDGEAVQRFYFSKGYPRAQVATEIRPHNGHVTVIHRITENSPARIGKIALRGNFKTRDWVIRQELRLREGAPLTVAAAERAQSNLRQSGLFETVQITYLGREDPRLKTVNVLVRVEERHDRTGDLQVSGGYSTDSKFFSEIGVGSMNVGGIGAQLSTRFLYGIADFSSFRREQLFLEGRLGLPRWIMRRLVGTDFLFDSTASYRIQNTERFGELTTIGGTLALSKEGRRGFFEGWLLSLRYDFRQRNRDVPLTRSSGNSDDIQEAKVRTRSSTLGPYLIIDKRRDDEGRKNPLTPERGFRLELRAVFAEDRILGSDRFIKLGGSFQHFLSVGKRLTLSNGIRYDHGIPLGNHVLLPAVERFFAGGDTTVRGFEEDRLATELVDNPLAPLAGVTQFQALPAGGNIRFLYNLDLQLRVWDDPWFDFPISSAIFVDTGLVTNSLVGFEVEHLRHSLGVALVRWILPLGSLSVEYAVPLDPALGDNPRGRFHLNLGVLF